MTRDYRQYLSLLIFSVVALPANAVPIQLLDVNRLEAASSVILVGKIASVQQTTKAVGQFGSQAVASFEMRADLIVQRVIKGAVNADHVDLWFYKPDEPAPYHDIRPGDSG